MRSRSVVGFHQPDRTGQSHFNGRALHLIDAENLLGGPNAPGVAVRRLWWVYRYGVPTTPTDQYFWATSQRLARRAVGVLPAHGLGF